MGRRFSRLDLMAGGLLLAGLLAALSVFSYDPADGPNPAIYPPHSSPANLLGLPGAWLAHLLHETFGIAVYVLLVAWLVLVIALLLRRDIGRWLGRLAGWLLLLPATAVIATQFGPIDGENQGGILGTWINALLSQMLPRVGQLSAIGIVVIVGASLSGDFILRKLRRLFLQNWQRCRSWHLRQPRPQSNVAVKPQPAVVLKVATKAEAKPTTESGIPIRHAHTAVPEGTATELPINRPGSAGGSVTTDYELPPLTLLEEPEPFPYEQHDQRLREQATLLERTFTDFHLNVRVVGINTGPVITQYEIALETGLRVNKVTRLGDDLALNLKVPSVRIVAPIPGKNTVGIEVPNEHRAVVRLKEVILAAGKKVASMKIPLFLGKDTEGRSLIYDLAEMPHLLIAGRTGTGKSVCMNAIILSMLMTRRPDEVKMIMIDPKMLELSEYGKIPHLMHPVVKDMKKAEAILSWAVDKMEERYELLSRARVRGIAGYNELSPAEIHRRVQPADDEERKRIPDKMPYIVIFVDEMNDLMMTMKKEVEGHIIRLAQKSRAAGIHLVVATQKPTVDVITGLIKSNLPARICFQVSSRTDSRVVLDEMGADKLLGKGDMLFLQPGTSTLVRAQGTYLSDVEITHVVEMLESEPDYAQELVQLSSSQDGKGGLMDNLRSRDEVYEQAIEVVIREGRGSVSLLQRALGIGYGRAARLIDFMAEDGIVGAYNGSSARDVLYTPEQWVQAKGGGQSAA
jgi:S-DNA-T family DNA segregation ATPase FtsK/SpoIIIE